MKYLQDTLQHCQVNTGLHWGYSEFPFFVWIYTTLTGTVQELCWNHRSQSPFSVLQEIVTTYCNMGSVVDKLQLLWKLTSTTDASTTPEEWGIANKGKSTKSSTSLHYTLFILLRLGLCWWTMLWYLPHPQRDYFQHSSHGPSWPSPSLGTRLVCVRNQILATMECSECVLQIWLTCEWFWPV